MLLVSTRKGLFAHEGDRIVGTSSSVCRAVILTPFLLSRSIRPGSSGAIVVNVVPFSR